MRDPAAGSAALETRRESHHQCPSCLAPGLSCQREGESQLSHSRTSERCKPPSCKRSLIPPRASAQQGGTGRRRSLPCAWLPSILCQNPAELCWHVGRHPGCTPRGLAGCLDALSGAQEHLWQGAASAANLTALPGRYRPHSLLHGTAGTERGRSRRACSEPDHPTNMQCKPWEQIALLRRVRREQERQRRGTGRRSTALASPARALGMLYSKQPCSSYYPSSPS